MTMPPAQSSSSERQIRIDRPSDIIALQSEARNFALAAGLSKVAAWQLAIAASEAATNTLKHGHGGQITLRTGDSPRPYVEFEAHDEGPGIASIPDALLDNISQGADARAAPDLRRRSGLGLGLGAIQRLCDLVDLRSEPGRGTTLRARKWIAT